MKKALSLFLKYLSLFAVMGSIYYMIEIMWRGYSHISMFILAGICGVCIGLINEILSMDTPIWLQAIIGSCIVTTGEFVSGCILNLWLGLGIWDYSNMPFNILGQICLPFSLLWVVLSACAIVIDDYERYWFFGEEKPYYLWKFKEKKMNDLTTVLRQRILIVYSDIEWRDEMFSKVLDAYPHDMINKMIKSRCGCWIELKDGTMIRFVYASDAARGIRANKIIAQPGIDETFLYTVFRRMLISNSDMYVATDNDIKPAAIYYTDEDTRNVK